MAATPYYCTTDSIIKFKLTKEKYPIQTLNKSMTVNGLNFEQYCKEFFKNADLNPITDTDKVLFLKSSKYPRSNFNRYSTKARRVEKFKTATKLVINPTYFYTNNYAYRDIFSIGGQQIRIPEFSKSDYQLLYGGRSRVRIKAISAQKELMEYLDTNYYVNQHYARQACRKILETQLNVSTSSNSLYAISAQNQGERELIDYLMAGHPETMYTTDTQVNTYVDKCKPSLDEGSYNIIKTALSKGDTNIMMGLKLLENMNIDSSLPYMYGLFVNAFVENSANIFKSKAYKTTGIKNIRANYDLDSLFYNNQDELRSSLGNMSNILENKLSSEEDKQLFRELCTDPINKALKASLGERTFEFLTLQPLVKQEEPKKEEEDGTDIN